MATPIIVSIQSSNFPAKILTTNRLLDFQEEKIDSIPQKVVEGKEPVTHEADAYSDYPRTFILDARLTTPERATLYDIENDGYTVYIRFDAVAMYECWIEKTEMSYRIVESVAAPWRTLIYMVLHSLVP